MAVRVRQQLHRHMIPPPSRRLNEAKISRWYIKPARKSPHLAALASIGPFNPVILVRRREWRSYFFPASKDYRREFVAGKCTTMALNPATEASLCDRQLQVDNLSRELETSFPCNDLWYQIKPCPVNKSIPAGDEPVAGVNSTFRFLLQTDDCRMNSEPLRSVPRPLIVVLDSFSQLYRGILPESFCTS